VKLVCPVAQEIKDEMVRVDYRILKCETLGNFLGLTLRLKDSMTATRQIDDEHYL
jgi:hypothetical protein